MPANGNATVSGSPVGASALPPLSGSGVGVGGFGVGGFGVGVGSGGVGLGGLGVGPGSAGATVNDAEAAPSANVAVSSCLPSASLAR